MYHAVAIVVNARILYSELAELCRTPFFTGATIFDELVKRRKFVIPAEAGIQNYLKLLDSGFHRNDMK